MIITLSCTQWSQVGNQKPQLSPLSIFSTLNVQSTDFQKATNSVGDFSKAIFFGPSLARFLQNGPGPALCVLRMCQDVSRLYICSHERTAPLKKSSVARYEDYRAVITKSRRNTTMLIKTNHLMDCRPVRVRSR